MRCSQCGLPLSPSRINCPRCATPVGGSERQTEITYDAPSLPQGTISSAGHEEGINQQQAQKEQPGDGTQQPYFTIEKSQLPMYTQQAKEQGQQQGWFPPPLTSTPTLTPSFLQKAEPIRTNKPASEPRRRQAARGLSMLSGSSISRTRLGFTVAGLCMGVGAIILIFVFIMTQSLHNIDSAALQAANQKNREKANAMVNPKVPLSPSPTILDITPTPNTPGSKYIDNIQIGTTINMNRVEITQITKVFKAGQKIYITMNVNSAGYQGAVCLDWYVQDVFVTHYAFPTTAADPSFPHSTAWSYATLMSKGTGYVNVSWATSTICADKVLAQRVDFSVGT